MAWLAASFLSPPKARLVRSAGLAESQMILGAADFKQRQCGGFRRNMAPKKGMILGFPAIVRPD